jgi:hypothetical protein
MCIFGAMKKKALLLQQITLLALLPLWTVAQRWHHYTEASSDGRGRTLMQGYQLMKNFWGEKVMPEEERKSCK